MSFNFNKNYFYEPMPYPSIFGNEDLRLPQIEAYYKVKEYFESNYENRNALVVLPTGVGKTGVMGLIPYEVSKGRVLIITPWTATKKSVVNSLDPDKHDNFWLKRNVFNSKSQLPNVIEYDGINTILEVLEAANIVILNVQKLQSRFESSLINRVGKDFFDMIIIDEAHHSTAKTWVECVDYFNEAKVVKLTGTPFRTDNERINGKLVYKYPLSRAMSNNYVKSLENIEWAPQELRLTIDDDETRTYSVDEIFDMKLKDIDWVTRSVAFSTECSQVIVDKSLELLEMKRSKNSNIPHKIIAVACSIEHARKICDLYRKKGYEVALLHSNLSEYDKNKALSDIENDRVSIVVNVAMLGEGYDHPYLSIAAVFRPFRNELPYTQFIGRILRYIDDNSTVASDNIGQIVAHKHLYLDKLWEKYKKEIQESDIIKHLTDYDEAGETEQSDNANSGQREIDSHGKVINIGGYYSSKEVYLDTELILKNNEEEEKSEKRVKAIMELYNITKDQAKALDLQMSSSDSMLKRPDKFYSFTKKGLDNRIREVIVPKLFTKYQINPDSDDLKRCSLFSGKYFFIPKNIKTNNGMIPMYINTYLRNEIGKKRKEWLTDDFNRASSILDKLEIYVEKAIEKFYNK